MKGRLVFALEFLLVFSVMFYRSAKTLKAKAFAFALACNGDQRSR